MGAKHCPDPSQILPMAQGVPAGRFVPVSPQVELLQTPIRHGLPRLHGKPVTQAGPPVPPPIEPAAPPPPIEPAAPPLPIEPAAPPPPIEPAAPPLPIEPAAPPPPIEPAAPPPPTDPAAPPPPTDPAAPSPPPTDPAAPPPPTEPATPLPPTDPAAPPAWSSSPALLIGSAPAVSPAPPCALAIPDIPLQFERPASPSDRRPPCAALFPAPLPPSVGVSPPSLHATRASEATIPNVQRPGVPLMTVRLTGPTPRFNTMYTCLAAAPKPPPSPESRAILHVAQVYGPPWGRPETPLIVDLLAHPWPTPSPGSVKAGTPGAALAGVMSSGRASTSGEDHLPRVPEGCEPCGLVDLPLGLRLEP